MQMIEKGIVFDIKEFAIFDGPGIRTTVFLKGCNLRCRWCHNPEGLSEKRELMVSANGCLSCQKCQMVCQRLEGDCTLCGACVKNCPLHLRKICGEEWEAPTLVDKLKKEQEFFEKNQGGVTFSGGEPLFQPDFLCDCLMRLQGIHRAIETSGYAHPEVFQCVVTHTDYVIMDIKLMNPILHQTYTGVDNRLILKNLDYLKQSGKPFVIRIPCIPGVNDTEDNMEQTAQALVGATNLQRVELLPYHKSAGAKYKMVGKTYRPEFDTESKPVFYMDCFVRRGIECITL